MNSAVPAGAYDALLARVLPQAREHRAWEPSDGRLPALFVSHGAPPTLDDAQWLDDLFTWGQSMPKPRAIVVVSAHWENAPAALSGTDAGTPLYYDFGGFHPRYYTLPYARAADTVRRGDVDALADYRTKAPGAHIAHPTADHFVPLLLTMGAAGDPASATSHLERMVFGNSIRSLLVH